MLLLLMLLCVGCASMRPDSPRVGGRELQKIVQRADSAVIFSNDDDAGKFFDAGELAGLGELLSRPAAVEDGFQCLCNADLIVILYIKDAAIAAIGLQPDGTISWPDGVVGGDLTFSDTDRIAIAAYYQRLFEIGTLIDGYAPPLL
ncbi:MAG: hypothetical protein ACI8W8_003230 [Rhodothermales bacterium]|jgi:hypothetical protein